MVWSRIRFLRRRLLGVTLSLIHISCYYQEIFEALHKKPGQCLMVGNHVREDIVPLQLGASVFLLTDYLENPDNTDFTVLPHGDWKDLFTFLEADRRA